MTSWTKFRRFSILACTKITEIACVTSSYYITILTVITIWTVRTVIFCHHFFKICTTIITIWAQCWFPRTFCTVTTLTFNRFNCTCCYGINYCLSTIISCWTFLTSSWTCSWLIITLSTGCHWRRTRLTIETRLTNITFCNCSTICFWIWQ